MKNVSHNMGNDGEESFISLYFMEDSLEIVRHEFDNYDSAVDVIELSYGMMDKIFELVHFVADRYGMKSIVALAGMAFVYRLCAIYAIDGLTATIAIVVLALLFFAFRHIELLNK